LAVINILHASKSGLAVAPHEMALFVDGNFLFACSTQWIGVKKDVLGINP
jgi:hypothetical protein